MERNKEYYAFISYKSEDVEWAIWLQHELEHYHLPASFNGRTDIRQELRPVFRDIDELSAGNLPVQIQQALENSQNLIVVCSPQAAASPWVNQEVETFISLGRIDRVFPFIVEGNSPKDFFPPALLALPKNEERLGGDASKQGRDIAFVKVVAGMLGLGFDSLWNRYEKEKAEEERKQREQRDKLRLLQIRFVAEKALNVIEDGNSLLARKLLMEVLPEDARDLGEIYSAEYEYALRKSFQTNSTIMRGHMGNVYSAVFSPDGKRIVSASEDKSVRIWDVRLGVQLGNPIAGHKGGVRFATFSPDGKQIVSASGDGTIRIWDVQTGQQKGNMWHSGIALFATYSPDGKLIMSMSRQKIRVWDALTNESVIEIKSWDNYSAAFSPDGKQIASASNDNICIWNLQTGKLIKRLEVISKDETPHDSHQNNDTETLYDNYPPVVRDSKAIFGIVVGTPYFTHMGVSTKSTLHAHSVSYSPNGKLIVSGYVDGSVRIWDINTGKLVMNPLKGHTGRVDSVSFSPNGEKIVSASVDGTVRIWDVNFGKQMNRPIFEKDDSDNTTDYCPVAKKAVSATMAGPARIWEKKTDIPIDKQLNNTLSEHTDCVNTAYFSSDGERVVSASMDGTIRIWKPMADKSNRKLLVRDSEDYVSPVGLSPDGKFVVSSLNDYSLQIRDIQTCSLVKEPLIGHTDIVSSISFSMDGKLIVSSSFDKTIRIWDTLTSKSICVLVGHSESVCDASFSPDGKMIASSSMDKTVRVWDIQTGKQIGRPFYGHTRGVSSVAFSPDGKTILSAGDKTIRVWDVKTGKQVGESFVGHTNWVNFASFSPDGKMVVSGSDDMTVRLWNAQSGKQIGTPIVWHADSHEWRSSWAPYAAFNQEGKLLVTIARDGIRVWNVQTRKTINDVFIEDFNVVYPVSFTPDDKKIVTILEDGYLHFFDNKSLQELIDESHYYFKNIPLSQEERRRYYLE